MAPGWRVTWPGAGDQGPGTFGKASYGACGCWAGLRLVVLAGSGPHAVMLGLLLRCGVLFAQHPGST